MKKLFKSFGPAVLVCAGPIFELSTVGEVSDFIVIMMIFVIIVQAFTLYCADHIQESLEARVKIWRDAFEGISVQLDELLETLRGARR